MIIHRHALLVDKRHILIIQVNAPPRGRWLGYVYLRLIEIDNATALRIAKGQQRTYVEQEGLLVHKSLSANKYSIGPKSAFTRVLAELNQAMDELLCEVDPEALDLLKGDIRVDRPASQEDIELMEHIEHREEYEDNVEALLELWDGIHFEAGE